jgi:hypothetical protein
MASHNSRLYFREMRMEISWASSGLRHFELPWSQAGYTPEASAPCGGHARAWLLPSARSATRECRRR